MRLRAALLLLLLGASGRAAAPAGQPSWSAVCTLSMTPITHHDAATPTAWFADVGEKVFQHDTAPAAGCGPALRLSAARGEHATFQIAVRSGSATALAGVGVGLSGGPKGLGALDVRRAAFTNVTTAANAVSSAGTGLYPDPLLPPDDTVIFPAGVGSVAPNTTAVFWVTLGPLAADLAAGVHRAQLSVSGAGISHPVELRVWDFTLPDAAHASQWTEADPFGSLQSCNILDTVRPKNCATNHSNWPHDEQPCLANSAVDARYAEMARHRINRVACKLRDYR